MDWHSFLRRKAALAALQLVAFLACATCVVGQNVTTWHVDNSRTGVQQNETILTTSNVNSTLFGKLFSFTVQGTVYAQPLYVYQYLMNDGNLHNVLIVATEEDMVYAFDADGNSSSPLWSQSLLASNETYVSYNDVGVTDISKNLGITGTPVIDPNAGIVYVVARSKTTASSPTFIQRLHALNLADGTETLNGPTVIAATLPGTGYDGESGATVSFDPLWNNQRSALLLAPTPNGPTSESVFITFASNGDSDPYHGWVIAYDASSDITNQTGVWVDTPNGGRGGIWMTGGGPSTDNQGNIFLGVANGTFDANSDYGESEVHLAMSGSGLAPVDSFTPCDYVGLTGASGTAGDMDMGMSSPVLLPPQSGGALGITNLLVTTDKGEPSSTGCTGDTGSKSGTIYLINANAMGGWLSAQDSSVQDFQVPGNAMIHSGFAFFNNTLYLAPDKSPLMAWTFDPSTEYFSTTPTSQSPTAFGSVSYVSGSTPSVSANNGTNGIVWALNNDNYNNIPPTLHAYDASNLANELYNSAQAAGGRDTAAGNATKFTTPTIANGKVYVGGLGAVTAYGLLPPPPAATPTFSPSGGTYAGTQSVGILDGTPNASIYYTTNGNPPNVGSTPYTPGTTIQVASSETIEAIAVASGYSQSQTGTAQYTITAPPPPQAATPTFSPPGGPYTSAQQVSILEGTPNASIYYTTNGNPPSTGSTPYTPGTTIPVSSSETIEAIAIASGYSQSLAGTATYTINSTPPPPSQVEVSLTSAANLVGIVTNGTKFTSASLNGDGCDYSANLLGSPVAYSGTDYAIGKANQKNVVKGGKSVVIPLPSGNYSTLTLLGLAVGTNQKTQVFTVTYSDKSTATFKQSLSDWLKAENYAGESIAMTMPYCDTKAGGETKGSHNLYQYSFTLNSAKTVKSFTLPSNSDVIVVAVTLGSGEAARKP
ncbi:MAG: chitobiase/beta-hexosaminidase C-terminal domain-containing protein [Terracidiphilus sp.]